LRRKTLIYQNEILSFGFAQDRLRFAPQNDKPSKQLTKALFRSNDQIALVYQPVVKLPCGIPAIRPARLPDSLIFIRARFLGIQIQLHRALDIFAEFSALVLYVSFDRHRLTSQLLAARLLPFSHSRTKPSITSQASFFVPFSAISAKCSQSGMSILLRI
jgi:hypothetical protein